MKTLLSLVMLSCIFVQTSFSQNTLDKAGLTAATPSSVAFSLRKLSSSYAGYAIRVRRSSDNAEANVAFDGSGTVSASSLVSFTPGVTIGATFGTTQTGNITSNVSKTGTITVNVTKTAKISVSSTSLTVTGISGTSFSTELVAGDRLFNGANNIFLGVVASITSNTSLLLSNYATITANAITYKTTTANVTGTGTNFTGELTTGDRLFNTTNTYLGTVASITNATTLSLNAVDAVSATATGYAGTSATITGTGTNFISLTVGDLLISNNITLGIISSITNASSLTLTAKAGGSVSGLAFKSTTGTISFSTYYAATSAYVNTWYDQSGNSRDAIQLKPGNQARIVNAGTLYIVNGRTSMEFSNTLAAFLETSSPASYLNNTLYTLNKVTAEATTSPVLQLPISTTGGGGPNNTISHYGYRSSSLFTVAQYGNDQDFNATPSTSLELHIAVKISTASSQFYKNGISLGILTSGTASSLNNVGLLNIGYYTPTASYYNGSISELAIFSSALASADITLLNNNQQAFYSIATTYWTGAVSTSWTNTGNWSTGIVPTISSPAIVVIPAGKPFYPIISGVSPANSISLEAATSLTITGTLQLAGTINNLGTCTASAGTIQYIGSAPQGIAANSIAGNTIQNMIINNSTGVSLNGNITVSGNITFTTGNLSIGSSVLTLGGTVTNTITGGLSGSSNSSLVISGTVSPTLSFDQTTVPTTNSLKNLTINSTGQIVTLANNLVLSGTGTTTFTAGKLAIGNTTLTIEGIVVNTVSDGLRGSISSNVVVDGTVSPTLSFDQTTSGTTNALNTLTLNCSGQTVTLNRSLVIISALNLTSGILADGGNQLVSTGTINLSSGTFKLGSPTVATIWPAFASNNITVGGTVEYASGIAQIVSAVPVYQNLTISAVGGATAANDLAVNGILSLSAANPSSTVGSLSMSTYTLNMGGSATTVGQGDVTGIVKRIIILPNVNYTMGNEFSSVTFPNTGTLPSQMSLKIKIGTAPTWLPGAINRVYDFIQTGGTGTKAVINAHYLDAELNGNIENKLVYFSYHFTGPLLLEQGKSNFNTTQNWVQLSNVNVAFFSSTFGNIEISLNKTALTTLTWNGSTSTSWITATNWTPNGGPSTNTDLFIPDASTTPNSPSLPATASNGSLTIESAGIVNSDPGAQLTLNNAGLAWSNVGGTFNAGTSTVIFTNANATINGTTNFNNITINNAAALLMTNGTTTRIGGIITNSGTWSSGLLNNTVEYNGSNQTILNPNGSTHSYYNLIISGSGTSVLPAASLNILGNLTINGAISGGSTFAMNGASAQSINGTSPLTLNILNINCASTVSLNQNTTIANTLTFTAGKMAIGSNTLTLSGNVVNTVPNGITGGTSSNLIVNGTVSPALSFDQATPGVSNALNNITINTAGQAPLLGSNLEVDGMIAFTAGKLAINGNTLSLKGDVTNTVTGGLTGSSSSNLVISGGVISPSLSFDQTTAGTSNMLNNFSVNSTGQTITLANPLVVGGSLGLTDGLITTTSANSLTLTQASTFTGGSNISFINGPLTRNTNGATGFVFPVGKLNVYRSVVVTPQSSAVGVYAAEYFPTIAPAGTYPIALTGIATNEYWDIAKISGPDATVTLTYTAGNTWSVGSPTSMDNIYVAHLNAGNWDLVYGSTIPGNTGNGLTPVTSKVLTSFSPFTFGFSPSTTLPVTLISFKANKVNNAVELLWISANESSLSRYDLERSSDGNNFYKIGSVAATNTSLIKSYNWLDNSPLQGPNFYKLKMINLDGVFTFSYIVEINMNAKEGITVYPNPVTGHVIMLQMYGQPKGMYSINLFSINGETVMNSTIMHDGNDAVLTLNLNRNLASGCYYLKISGPDKNTTFKLLIN
jgi:Secretion system C-terminal sorting domain